MQPTWAARWWRLTLLALAATMAWDASGLDLTVMRWLGSPSGFALQHQWWLETVMHDAARRAATLAYLLLWLMVWRPVGLFRRLPRLERLEMVVGVTVALLMVTALKRTSQTSCPWDLQAFGGVANYVSHWQWGVADGGGGHCFPGGHASSALAFVAVVLPGLALAGDSLQRRDARRGLMLLLTVGAALGAAQTLRGAHYPSHTLWTGWICWVSATLVHVAFRWRRERAD